MLRDLQQKLLLLLMFMAVGAGRVWADETPYYTLDTTTETSENKGSGNNYASDNTATVSGIGWTANANTQMFPWRIGGKNISNVDRAVYTTTAMGSAIDKIELEVGSASSITVNSLKLIVASDANFNTKLDEVSATFAQNSTISFTPKQGTEWAKDAYYKFVFNVSVSGNSNKFVEFKTVKFYAPSETSPLVAAPTFSLPAGEVAKGTTVTLTQDDAAYIIYTTDGSNPTWEPMNGEEYSGAITISKTTTVKAIAVDDNENVSSVASATYTVAKADAEIGFTVGSYDVSVDDIEGFTSQLVNNPHGLDITYSVAPAKIASIDAETGEVTLTGATGKATVTATFAGDDDYNAAVATYTIVVYNPSEALFDFESKSDDYGSGLTTTSDNDTFITDDTDWTNGVVTITTSGKYRWWDNGGTLRFYKADNTGFTVKVADGYVVTSITITGGQQFKSDVGTYTSSNGTWTGVAKSVKLSYNANSGSVNVKTITVDYTNKLTKDVESYGWASYITIESSQFADGDAYVVTEASVAGGLTVEAVTSVPAGTPVLLKGEGTKTVTLLSAAPDAPEKNLLTVSDGTVAADKYAYVLAKDGAGACFKQWTGEASVLAGRAVLLLDEPVATARTMFALDDVVTGIDSLSGDSRQTTTIYDLQGRRVGASALRQGLYIVNGRKVVVR